MKRDMDIVRRIAIETADMPFGAVLTGLDGVSAPAFVAHVQWMSEAGLIVGLTEEPLSGDVGFAHVIRLTWQGCEFADAVSSETVWEKAKRAVIKPSASWTFDVLKEWLKVELSQGLSTIGR